MPHTIRFSNHSLILPLLAATLLFAGCSRAEAGSGPGIVKSATLHGEIDAGKAPLVVDVRTPEEFAAGHVPGAINIPYDRMAARSGEIIARKDSSIVLYCRSGRRSGIAAKVLADRGFKHVDLLEGDMPGWERDGYPVER
jgi:rhodanese-related sulfurtransferase